jgi:hypothetical protein
LTVTELETIFQSIESQSMDPLPPLWKRRDVLEALPALYGGPVRGSDERSFPWRELALSLTYPLMRCAPTLHQLQDLVDQTRAAATTDQSTVAAPPAAQWRWWSRLHGFIRGIWSRSGA